MLTWLLIIFIISSIFGIINPYELKDKAYAKIKVIFPYIKNFINKIKEKSK